MTEHIPPSATLLIPKIIHRIWTGGEMPEEFRRFGETWREHHPGWEQRLWTEADLPSLDCRNLMDRAVGVSSRSNMIRLEVVHRFGGIYVDTDFECLRCLEPLLGGVAAFAGIEEGNRLGSAIFGAVPADPWVKDQIDRLPEYVDREPPWGPTLITESAARFAHVVRFPPAHFYPYRWNQPKPAGGFPDSYAVHHWSGLWKDGMLKRGLRAVRRLFVGALGREGPQRPGPGGRKKT